LRVDWGKQGDGKRGGAFNAPMEFLREKASQAGVELPELYAVAVVFTKDKALLEVVEEFCAKNDLKVVLKRDVPIDTNALGDQALETLPHIVQVFITPNSIMGRKRSMPWWI